MATKPSALTVGVTALGLLVTAAGDPVAAGPDEPIPATAPPSAPAPANPGSPSPSVLLLTNGRTLVGQITEEKDRYVLRQNGGTIPIPRAQVERAFGSLPEVYRHKREQIPEGDPDERLKLGRWCLSHGLPGEAREEMQAVVALSPGSREAKAMLISIEAAAARPAQSRVDPSVVQTRAESVGGRPGRGNAGAGAGGEPGEINPGVLRNARRELGLNGVPVIFDLPPALAVPRAEAFARAVHPVLQAACARCHNEQYEGNFQLVETKGKRGPSGDALRANLDATLQLVDRDDTARSELLALTLLPHGRGPKPKPIFRGSNDPQFQILVKWVSSLRDPRTPKGGAGGDGLSRAGDSNRGGGAGAFGVDRDPNAPAASGFSTQPLMTGLGQGRRDSNIREENVNIPPVRYDPTTGPVRESEPPSPDEFPVPFAAGGRPPGANPADPGKQPPVKSDAATGAGPRAGADVSPPLPELPPAGPAVKPAAAAKPKKSVKIDPALLEGILKNRNKGQ